MSKILIGHDRETGKPVHLPLKALPRHLHLVGYTGSGKTTAILTILFQLFANPFYRPCTVILDRLGGFSEDLLRWFASTWCPSWVRDRLLYIEAAREDLVVPMNPLLHETKGEGFFRVARATEIVLRGWASQDISQMPRLARWMFNSFWAAAQLGLTIGDCVHLLRPRSDLHKLLIGALPEALKWEWQQILSANSSEAERQLESCRNRLTPIFESPFLRATFSSSRNYLDVLSWMRDRKIVVINLAPQGRVPETIADMLGGLIVNEVTSVARSLPPRERVDTLLVLDEFQRFVGPDLEYSLAESRQLKTALVLSHQSFSQLKTEETDLTSLIFQAQSRLILNVQGFDAELLAGELAGLTYDTSRIKDEIWHRCQRVSGHKIVELQSWGETSQKARQWSEIEGRNWQEGEGTARRDGSTERVRTEKTGRGGQTGKSEGGSETTGSQRGGHEALTPIYEEYLQRASTTYVSFDEQKQEWGRRVRLLKQGQGIWRTVDDQDVHEIDVKRTAPGVLGLDWTLVSERMPQAVEAYEQLKERNFRQECFVTPVVIERETRERLQRVLRPAITLVSPPPPALPAPKEESKESGDGFN